MRSLGLRVAFGSLKFTEILDNYIKINAKKAFCAQLLTSGSTADSKSLFSKTF